MAITSSYMHALDLTTWVFGCVQPMGIDQHLLIGQHLSLELFQIRQL